MILNKLIRIGNSVASTVRIQTGNLTYAISRSSSVSCGSEFEHNDCLILQPKNEMQKISRPKPPLKPFLRFAMKYRSLFQAKYPDAGANEIMRRLGMVWNQMSNENRSEYFDSYARESNDYFESLQQYKTYMNVEYQKSLDEKMKRQKRREENMRKKLLKRYFRMPVKPGNVFLLFSEERKKEENVITKTREDCNKWISEMAKVWKQLGEKQKKKYLDEFKKLKLAYESVMIEWEKEVVEEGYAFLLPDSKRIDFQPTNVHYRRKSRSELLRLQKDPCEELDDPSEIKSRRSRIEDNLSQSFTS